MYRSYYFALLSLPQLSFKEPLEITFQDLRDLLLLNLAPADFVQFTILLQWINLYNVRAVWLGQPLDDRGTMTSKEVEEALLVRDGLPSYLIDYLDRYETVSQRLSYFPSLLVSLFQKATLLHGFLRAYYHFERDLQLLLTALRAKKTKRDIVYELQFEDPTDSLVAQILAQKDAPEFVVPFEYEDLKILFVENNSDPEKLHRALLEYRFRKIEEMEEAFTDPFSLDAVLGYVARFILVDDWFKNDPEKGHLVVEAMSQYE
ncbi:MAG: DUF2764 family protein [Chlamydiia bacterium]|nr:DUF2764 family protein [Chlamydiia bacterium]